MFVQELGKKAAVPSVYGLTFYMLGSEKITADIRSPRTAGWWELRSGRGSGVSQVTNRMEGPYDAFPKLVFQKTPEFAGNLVT